MDLRTVFRSALLGFLGTFFTLGHILSPNWSVAPQTAVSEITRSDECQLNENWECAGSHHPLIAVDMGAPGWQEQPMAHFFQKAQELNLPTPKWNFFINSGYPEFLDGITRKVSPSQVWENHNPTNQGRDILIFFRFFAWAFGIVLSLNLLGLPVIWQALAGLWATKIPYAMLYLDIVFLDVDLMAPWLVVWAILALRKDDDKRVNIPFIFFSAALGFWISIQIFVQSQIVFGLVLSIISGVCFFYNRKKSLLGYAAFLAGLLPLSIQQALIFKDGLPFLMSSRLPGVCYANIGVGMSGLEHAITTPFQTFGLVVIAVSIFLTKRLPLAIIYALVTTALILGLPLCWLEGVNGVRFYRHLVPYAQAMYFILSFISCWSIARKLKWRKGAPTAAMVFLLAFSIFPFLYHPWYFKDFITGARSADYHWKASPIPTNNVFNQIQQYSQKEARRHFSPDGRLYPNWSAALQILDLRVLFAFYPRYTYELQEKLYPHWDRDLHFGGRPDRFVGPTSDHMNFDTDMVKLLATNHVSLITFSKKLDLMPPYGIYSKADCNLLSTDQVAQAWICPKISGIGFFPNFIHRLENENAFLGLIPGESPERLATGAYVFDPDGRLLPARGTVKTSAINMDDTATFDLNVAQGGIFVFADTWFPGWHVLVNGEERPIIRVNHAWKAVEVPQGYVALKWYFKPN